MDDNLQDISMGWCEIIVKPSNPECICQTCLSAITAFDCHREQIWAWEYYYWGQTRAVCWHLASSRNLAVTYKQLQVLTWLPNDKGKTRDRFMVLWFYILRVHGLSTLKVTELEIQLVVNLLSERLYFKVATKSWRKWGEVTKDLFTGARVCNLRGNYRHSIWHRHRLVWVRDEMTGLQAGTSEQGVRWTRDFRPHCYPPVHITSPHRNLLIAVKSFIPFPYSWEACWYPIGNIHSNKHMAEFFFDLLKPEAYSLSLTTEPDDCSCPVGLIHHGFIAS